MKKIIYILLLVTVAIFSFFSGMYFSDADVPVKNIANSDNTLNISRQTNNTEVETGTTEINTETDKTNINTDEKITEEKSPKAEQQNIPTSTKNYEEALASVVDTENFQKEMDDVFERFNNEPITQDGQTLQSTIKSKMFSSGTYDQLLSKNVQFSDAECRLSLCRLEFNITDTTRVNGNEDFAIINSLNSNFMNIDSKTKVYSKIEDGKLSFFIGRGYLSE
ncbi:hypothetical protein [Kangiella shandongensis]|uniref:hypothetical protein n=1 Tax=Kangiella shandongensis TaxID=2763258 RepID=UPI001CBF09AD|nr:hypothetical protein [Kangiella shandongensis]